MPRITTRVDPCVPIDLESFHKVLAIELGTSIEYSADSNQPSSVTTVFVSCAPLGIDLALVDGVTRKTMRRVVDLAAVEPAARSRLLALTVAEFVVASWVELRLPEPPPIAPAGPPPPPQVQSGAAQVVGRRIPPPSAASERPEWQLSAAFEMNLISSAPQLIPGFGLHLSQRPLPQLEFGLGVQYGHGELYAYRQGARIGEVPISTSTAIISLRYIGRVGDFELSAGAGGRIGVAHMAGRTGQSGVMSLQIYAPWGGPALLLGVAYRAGPQLRLFVSGEVGWITQTFKGGLRTTDEIVLELKDAWAGFSVGFGWAF